MPTPKIRPPYTYYPILFLNPLLTGIHSIPRTLSTIILLATAGAIELYSLAIGVGSIIAIETTTGLPLYTLIGILRRSSS